MVFHWCAPEWALLPWSQRLSFNIIFFHLGFLRREELIEALSREKKKASGRERWESHFHAGSALDSCQRFHFLLTNHKGGSDLQFVDRAGWVSPPVLRNKLLRKERRGTFAMFTSCQTSRVLFSFLKKGQITSMALKMERKNIKRCLGGLRMEDRVERSPQTCLGNNFSSFNRDKNKTIGALSSVSLRNTDQGLKQLPGL